MPLAEASTLGSVDHAVFVPAIMSVGLLFSVATIVRDVLHDHRRAGPRRRTTIAVRTVGRHLRDGTSATEHLGAALRPRTTYLLTAVTSLGASIYIAVGAFLNFTRVEGYVSDIGWLLAVSALTASVLFAVGTASIALFLAWPQAPGWAGDLLVATPFGQVPDTDATRSERRFLLGWGTVVAAVCFGVLTLGIANSSAAFDRTDNAVANLIDRLEWLDHVAALDLLGTTEVAVGLALLVGVATLRCVPFAVVYLSSVIGTIVADSVIKAIIERPRPAGTTLSALTDSYPSGHLAQIVLITGFVPLAIEVLTDLKWHTHLIGSILAGTVVVAGLVRIDEGWHWPSDIAGGILLGTTVSLLGHWVLESSTWHSRCHACPWVPHEHEPIGAIHIPDGLADHLRQAALAWSAIAISGFALLGVVQGIPRSPDNDLLGVQIEQPLNILALTIATIGWAIALHWNGAGAVGLVVGGSMLAVLSSIAYDPAVSVVILGIFVAPAVALWLAWQHDQSRRAVIVLASVTAFLLIGVYSASAAVYGHFFGPQHPQSETAALPVDRVDWVLAGAVSDDGFRVSARVAEDLDGDARLVVTDTTDEVAFISRNVPIPDTRIVRFSVHGLDASTRYHYAVEVDDLLDTARGRGTISTFASGAQNLRVAISSCARTGSNGRVFDAIREADPDLYLVTGDLHYGNPDQADPDLFRRHFDRVFTASAQAALLRSVPFAYVWDDHDYGPNDADGSSPTRDTARQVYREVVPSFVEDDGPINQAFTAGRVRFVITDTRSARSPDSMLGPDQFAWLLDELRSAARTHALMVWVNPDPWVSPADPSRDDWGAYPADRDRILEMLEAEAIDNLVMVSGDAHMVAIDDGTNTGGFPLLHAAALDRPGTVKGGPYSEGTYPGAGQFGLLEVADDGGESIDVTLSGRRWDGSELVRKVFTFAVPTARSMT